ncbi:hypothetical protein KFE26_23070 [Shewanella sp. M16]|uniref:hypothetical protein n=1 Tax=Shewanella sp. M16 TaxID=2830837 RepID=UPI001BAF2BF1|nr:hypothetical protein [Shewanella sp. M16]MBS0045133.1 hypothetical protein [Shewanella sp. M16]
MKKRKKNTQSSAVVCPEKNTLEIKKIQLELVEMRLKILALMVSIPLTITALIVALDKLIN